MFQPVIWFLYLGMGFVSLLFLLVFLEADSFRKSRERPDEWPSVTICTPAYNEEDTIAMTIESVLDVDYPEDKLDYVVVNDGSTDRTREEIEKFDDVNAVHQENQGKGAAVNKALHRSDSDLFAVVDADSYLGEDSLKNIIAEMDDDMEGIASAMKVKDPGNLLQKAQRVEYIVSIFLRKTLGIVDSIQVAPGPLSVYRRETLEGLGGFDPESRVEDQEICFRLHDRGLKLGHSWSGEVYTVAPDSLKKFYNQRYRWQRGSMEEMINYRHMILNPKYGEFGFLGIPLKLLQSVLSTIGFLLIIYTTLKPLANIIGNLLDQGLSFIELGGGELLEQAYWTVLGLEGTTVVMFIYLTAVSLATAFLAGRHTREPIFKHGVLPAGIYLFFYFYIIVPIWLKVYFDMLVGREKGW